MAQVAHGGFQQAAARSGQGRSPFRMVVALPASVPTRGTGQVTEIVRAGAATLVSARRQPGSTVVATGRLAPRRVQGARGLARASQRPRPKPARPHAVGRVERVERSGTAWRPGGPRPVPGRQARGTRPGRMASARY
jgi:hypothetical protein